jgi:signal transduction histidine kinase
MKEKSLSLIKELGPKKRFTLTLVLIYVVSLPVMSGITYVILKNNAIRDAYTEGRLYLSTIGALKHYVSEEVRPIFYKEMPGRFIVQGMSRSFAAADVAGRVKGELPNYSYKNASLNPRNPLDAADDFEASIITTFMNNRSLVEWRGFRTKSDHRYYVLARPGDPFTQGCLKCHGDPKDAPRELIERYGTEAGFFMKTGEIADAIFVYIPINVPLAHARGVVAVFIGLYILIGAIILLIVNIRFKTLYNTIDYDKKRIEEINIEVMHLNNDMESLITERTLNLIALNIADRIRNPASVIAGTFNRILKREDLPEPVRERLCDLVSESQKLESIVKDYETILKTTPTMFKVEDLNEIIGSVLPLVEKERKTRGIEISLKLADNPQKFMANRQLIRVAVLDILENAVEAAPGKSRVVVETSGDHNIVALSVIDNGKGISPEELPQIFNLFFSTKKRKIGMGLPLVKQIVEEHKGDITVESIPGKETTVRITFPVRWTEQELSRHVVRNGEPD